MRKAIFSDRIEKEGKQLVRIVNGRWSTKKFGSGNMDVYKVYEDGSIYARNLYFTYIAGYTVDDSHTDDNWYECDYKLNAFHTDFTKTLNNSDIVTLKEHCPEFKYALEKLQIRNWGSTDVIDAWNTYLAFKRWPGMERLMNAGYFELAKSKQFAEMPYLKQVEIIQWLENNNKGVNLPLGIIRALRKSKLTFEEYKVQNRFKLSIDTIKYLKNQLKKDTVFNEVYSLDTLAGVYKDYINMAKKMNHDVEDNYWKYPNDLKKANDKVLNENKRAEFNRQQMKKKQYSNTVKKFKNKKLLLGNFSVYIPQSMEEIEIQADILHQCLMWADYINKVIVRKCLLVFIQKDNKPWATAEIDRNGKVTQFYGDERNKELMHPGNEEKIVLDKFLQKFKPKITARKAA